MTVEHDLEVQTQALVLAQSQRDEATRWAQRLAWLIERFIYEGAPGVTEGGMLAAVAEAKEAGFDPDVARVRWERGEP